MTDDAVVVLETFDDPDLARGYRDAVLRSMQRRSLQQRYAVGIRVKQVAGSRQWWVVLRDRSRRPL